VSQDIWPLVHAERSALANDLGDLSDEQWQTTSLCDKWNVREVLAHMTAAACNTPPKFLLGFARKGFNFDNYVDSDLRQYLGTDAVQTLDTFRAAAHRTSAPPGPKATWLGETVIHAEDIRCPLGIAHTYDAEALTRVVDFYCGSNTFIGSKSRIAGLRLQATDTDWSAGVGPVASGPMLAIAMAMTGRKGYLDQLEGDGVEVLRNRD
jgi:uncharacterized protein (TIGR03083 family)